MAITRRKFTLEFRTEAAHRVIDTGRSVRAVASELSIEENTLSK
jgi:transposase